MNRRSILLACALVLVVVTGASAQQVATGTVARIDPAANVIVFDDGRMFQTTAEILMNNQRMPLSALQPGTRITLHQARQVMLQNGRYVLVANAAPSVVVRPAPVVTSPPVAVVPAPAAVVVAPAPTAVVVAPPPIVVREEPIVGTVARVDVAAGHIILTDHRVVQVTPGDTVLINDVPMPLGSVPIGSRVVIRSDTPMSALPGWDSERDHTGAKSQAPGT